MTQCKDYDAIAVGGGPAGLIAATELANGGLPTLVLEEHPHIGLPDHCAGLVSISGLKRVGIQPSSDSIQNLVSGARLIAPNGCVFEIGGNEDKAYVLNRALFDKSLAVAAIEAGVEIEINSRAMQVSRRDGGFLLNTSSGRVYACRLLVISEGISCRILKSLGLTPPPLDWIFPAAQFEISGVHLSSELVELYFGQNVAPGFFAWSIPMSENSSKIGLAIEKGNPLKMLRSFRERYFPSSQVFSVRLGRVTLGGPITRASDAGLLVVGDAAGQSKPTTGGGVVVGGLCAKIAGQVGLLALLEDDLSSGRLSDYDQRWRRTLGGELAKMRTLRQMFPKLSDNSLNRLFEFASESDLRKIIEEKGDMDFQADMISRVMRQPGIHGLLLSIGGDVITSLFK